MIYLDSNLFIFGRLDNGKTGRHSRALIKLVEEGSFTAGTSALTLDEVVWIVGTELDQNKAIEYGKRILQSKVKIFPVTNETITHALDIMERYNLMPRDAIHTAVMLKHGIFTIITQDDDFKHVKEIDKMSFKTALNKLKG